MAISAEGCSIVAWPDAIGNSRHFGLFLYQMNHLGRGHSLERMSVGADFRLSGEDRGICVGLKWMRLMMPDLVIAAPETLARDVYANLTMNGNPHDVDMRRGALFLTENISVNATRFETACIGFE